MSEYQRSKDLGVKLNKFLNGLTGEEEDYFSNLTQLQLIELKAALANVNNVLTLKTTMAFAHWLSKTLRFNNAEHKKLIKDIDSVGPNTNGYDIRLDEQLIIAEIKGTDPVNRGNYFGAAQRTSILNDVRKLLNGKQDLLNRTSNYIKFIGIIDLGNRTDQAISKLMTPAQNINTEEPRRRELHEMVEHLELFNEGTNFSNLSTNKVYIKKVKI